ncbi:MAG: prephenate dehydrogenase/arogenate dehydrogenase family protein, partial [Gammaproteobacteria bacterium]|nr:prephenate dehydrogenase/arogenate dehydrogenase family protein [Gammaproteobacteria bacterium]
MNDSAKSASLGNVAILGVGLIGGSLAAGLKKAGCVDRVWGFGRSQANLDKAIDLGLVDYASTA